MYSRRTGIAETNARFVERVHRASFLDPFAIMPRLRAGPREARLAVHLSRGVARGRVIVKLVNGPTRTER